MPRDSSIMQQIKQMRVNMLILAATTIWYMERYLDKKPCRDSALPGHDYVQELLEGHLERFRQVCRMEKGVFMKLCEVLCERNLLQGTRATIVEEQLIIFLFTLGHKAVNQQVQERFQHSGEMISRHFNNILNAIVSLSLDYIRLPSIDTPSKIANDKRLYPFFQDCIGAIDGTHIPIVIDVEYQAPYRSRKGCLSRKVMAASSFDMIFVHVQAGWEGSAADSTVLPAVKRSRFHVPKGKYYLGDARYANTPSYIASFRGVRYHLREFACGNRGPLDAK